MGLVDREGLPLGVFHRAPGYWIWLLGEITKSNIDVCKRIIDPKLPIDPVETELSASQATDLGRVTYANSITLTPGTVSTGVHDGTITIHALVSSAAEDLKKGVMDEKARRLESGR